MGCIGPLAVYSPTLSSDEKFLYFVVLSTCSGLSSRSNDWLGGLPVPTSTTSSPMVCTPLAFFPALQGSLSRLSSATLTQQHVIPLCFLGFQWRLQLCCYVFNILTALSHLTLFPSLLLFHVSLFFCNYIIETILLMMPNSSLSVFF